MKFLLCKNPKPLRISVCGWCKKLVTKNFYLGVPFTIRDLMPAEVYGFLVRDDDKQILNWIFNKGERFEIFTRSNAVLSGESHHSVANPFSGGTNFDGKNPNFYWWLTVSKSNQPFTVNIIFTLTQV